MRRIPEGSEATTVLVGSVLFLQQPVMAFVRLSEGCFLGNLTEVPLPVRFLFILMGPPNQNMDYVEIGRSISTLMANTVSWMMRFVSEIKFGRVLEKQSYWTVTMTFWSISCEITLGWIWQNPINDKSTLQHQSITWTSKKTYAYIYILCHSFTLIRHR